jgi:hypothetical protein
MQLEARLAGLALTQSLQLGGLLQWMVRQTAEVENHMTSVERMLAYTELEQVRLEKGWGWFGDAGDLGAGEEGSCLLTWCVLSLQANCRWDERCARFLAARACGPSTLTLPMHPSTIGHPGSSWLSADVLLCFRRSRRLSLRAGASPLLAGPVPAASSTTR